MPSLVNDPGKTSEGENLIKRDLYYSWTDLQSFISKNAPPQKITEPKNTLKIVPKQQTDLQTNLPRKLWLYRFGRTTVRNPYGPVHTTVRNCPYGCTKLYGTFPYGCTDLSVHCTDYTDCTNTLFLKIWKLFLLEKCANSRKTCRNSFFSKTVQKFCFWSSLFLISVPYFSLSANHFLMSRHNSFSLSTRLSHHKSFSQWFFSDALPNEWSI